MSDSDNTNRKRKSPDVEPNFPIKITNTEDLRTTLTCPVCYSWLRSPVMECKNGHVICSSCLEKIPSRACQECRDISGYTTTCRRLDTFLENFQTLCKYDCGTQLQISALYIHEDNCDQRPRQCPFKCKNYVQRKHMEKHLADKHQLITTLSGPCHSFFTLQQGVTAKIKKTTLHKLRHDDQDFILCEDILDSGVIWTVRSFRRLRNPLVAEISVSGQDPVCNAKFSLRIADMFDEVDCRFTAFLAANTLIDWSHNIEEQHWTYMLRFKQE